MANITIPLGFKYKFEPQDHELLVYLSCKANGEPLPCEGLIREIDLYGLADPGKLFDRTEEEVVYVFTKLKKVAKNGKRVDRSVLGNRTWKGVDGGQPIYDADGRLVGEKKNFVLVNKMKMKLGYNMKEFALVKEALRNSRFNDYVLCQIKKKDKKARSLKYGNFPEEDACITSVSVPAIEGDAMEYSGGTSNLMPRLYEDFESDNALISTGFFQELNSRITDMTVERNEFSYLGMLEELASLPSSDDLDRVINL